jgi:deoxyribonuclease-4
MEKNPKTFNDLLGAHCSVAGGVYTAFERAEKIGATAMQIFSKNNNQWKGKRLTDEDREAWFAAWKASKVKEVVVHDSYLINLGSQDKSLYERSYDAFVDEIHRCHELAINVLNFHPGAHTGAGEEFSIAKIAEALNRAHDATKDCNEVISTMELTAGQGSSIGYSFEHIRAIMDKAENKKRIGVCIDTCHIFAAGYDIREKKSYTHTMKLFDEIIGFDNLKLVHMNDSKKDIGSHVDRHEHIGKGFIGKEAFRLLMNDKRFKKIPKVLETPKGEDLKDDIVNLKLLRSFVKK